MNRSSNEISQLSCQRATLLHVLSRSVRVPVWAMVAFLVLVIAANAFVVRKLLDRAMSSDDYRQYLGKDSRDLTTVLGNSETIEQIKPGTSRYDYYNGADSAFSGTRKPIVEVWWWLHGKNSVAVGFDKNGTAVYVAGLGQNNSARLIPESEAESD